MKIRPMKIADYPGAYDLWKTSEGMGLNDVDDSEAGIARLLKRNPNICLVAEEAGKIIGVILAGDDGRRATIYHTAVKKGYKRQGIGRKLAETCLLALVNEGVTKVQLLVFGRNKGARKFWENLGFEQRTPDQEDVILYGKPLVEMTRTDT